jgi:hypothetical protein
MRPTDLDCDLHEAPDADCNDLRADFHATQPEMCDGLDSNCDGDSLIVQQCPTTATACAGETDRGTQLCDDRSGELVGACVPDPECRCATGNPGPCNKCILSFRATSVSDQQSPCAPAIGKLHFESCTSNTPCEIEVVSQVGPWKAFIAPEAEGPFGTSLPAVTGDFFLEVKLSGATSLMADPATSVGATYLVVTQNGVSRQVGIDLQLAAQGVDACNDEANSSGASVMACAAAP